jgi:hypothetical protein
MQYFFPCVIDVTFKSALFNFKEGAEYVGLKKPNRGQYSELGQNLNKW